MGRTADTAKKKRMRELEDIATEATQNETEEKRQKQTKTEPEHQWAVGPPVASSKARSTENLSG